MSYPWLRFIHLLGVFGFIASHGATATVTFVIRKERDPARVRTMLDISRSTRSLMYVSFLTLLGAGIWAGFVGHWWQMKWIWVSLVLLFVLFGAAFPLAVPYFRAIRRTLDQEPVDREKLATLLSSSRGALLAWVETIGIVIILYLMMFKPF